MPVVGNRIKVASSDTGTGNITLGSAEDGFQTFADGGISNNDVVRYVITEGSSFEIGKGTYLTSGPTLVRTSGNLLESSTGSLLDLGGSATVFVSLADVDVMQTDGGTFTGDVTFTGNNHSGVTWDTSEDEFLFAEGSRIDFGGGANIRRESDGILRITGATADDTYFNFSNNLIFYRGGSAAAQLMYSDSSQRFHAYGNITVGGTVDGVDIAVRDAVLTSTTTTANAAMPKSGGTFTGDVTFNEDLLVGQNDMLWLGYVSGNTNQGMQLFHGGTSATIENHNFAITYKSDGHTFKRHSTDREYMTLNEDVNHTVSLKAAGTTRLQTSGTGVDVTGTVTDDGATHDGDVVFTGSTVNITFDQSANALSFDDGARAYFGSSSDLTIYHEGVSSETRLWNVTGDLNLTNFANDKDIVIATDNGSGGTANYFLADGSTGEAKLFFYGSEKLATKTGGVEVQGTVTATSFSGDGSGLTNISSGGVSLAVAIALG